MRVLLSLFVAMVAMVMTEARSMPMQPNMNNAVRPNAPNRDFWPGPGALPRMPQTMPNSIFPPMPFMNFRPGMNGRMPFVMPGRPRKGMFGGNNLLPMMFATNVIDEEMLPFMLMAGM